MNTVYFTQWSHELAHERRQQLIQEATHWRLVQSLRPAANRSWLRRQPLALLRTWRLVTPRLQLAGPADEAQCS